MIPARRGFVFMQLLLAAGVAGILALVIVADTAQRARQARIHQVRVQGREWCLGARLLPPGTVVEEGAWRIAVAADRAVSAAGPLGTYRIAADGGESWAVRGAGAAP